MNGAQTQDVHSTRLQFSFVFAVVFVFLFFFSMVLHRVIVPMLDGIPSPVSASLTICTLHCITYVPDKCRHPRVVCVDVKTFHRAVSA